LEVSVPSVEFSEYFSHKRLTSPSLSSDSPSPFLTFAAFNLDPTQIPWSKPRKISVSPRFILQFCDLSSNSPPSTPVPGGASCVANINVFRPKWATDSKSLFLVALFSLSSKILGHSLPTANSVFSAVIPFFSELPGPPTEKTGRAPLFPLQVFQDITSIVVLYSLLHFP